MFLVLAHAFSSHCSSMRDLYLCCEPGSIKNTAILFVCEGLSCVKFCTVRMRKAILWNRLKESFLKSFRYGFIIAVTTIDNIGVGHIQPGRGFVVYPVKYKVR